MNPQNLHISMQFHTVYKTSREDLSGGASAPQGFDSEKRY